MAKKRHNRYEKSVVNEHRWYETTKGRLVIGLVAVVAVIAIIFGTGLVHIPSSGGNSNSNFVAPTQIQQNGTFVKISTTDYAKSNAYSIYFVSWIGCPIGASESWGFYGLFSNYMSFTSSQYYSHTSDPNEGSVSSIPGLIFTSGLSFQAKGNQYSFSAYYMYNESLDGTNPGNTPIATADLVSHGESVINGSAMPPAISQFAYKYTHDIPVEPKGIPSAFLGTPAHVNTVIIVSGPSGTFLLNGAAFPPADIRQYSPSYMQANYNSIADITNWEATLSAQLGLS